MTINFLDFIYLLNIDSLVECINIINLDYIINTILSNFVDISLLILIGINTIYFTSKNVGNAVLKGIQSVAGLSIIGRAAYDIHKARSESNNSGNNNNPDNNSSDNDSSKNKDNTTTTKDSGTSNDNKNNTTTTTTTKDSETSNDNKK
jgi:hypothetical protein